MLLDLTKKWAKDGFTVSFKLETDQELVVLKSKAAIAKYGVSLVVANQLQVFNLPYSSIFCFLCFSF
jgi:phosphopantothenate---cysteine ligase (ATP)